jgi:hypothetical protein
MLKKHIKNKKVNYFFQARLAGPGSGLSGPNWPGRANLAGLLTSLEFNLDLMFLASMIFPLIFSTTWG